MQVGPSGPASGAHGPQGLALRHRLTHTHINAAQVGINGFVAVAMRQRDHIAITTLLARCLDHTVTHTAHGGACGGGVIDPQMGAPGLQNRVKPQFEAAGHAGKSQGGCQISTTQALAGQIKVPPLGRGGLLEPDRMVGFAIVQKLRGQNLARAQGFSIGFERLINNREAVAFAQGPVKINVTGKYVSQLMGHAVRNAGLIGGGKQRGLNDPTGHLGGGLQRRLLQGRGECAIGLASDAQALELAAIITGPTGHQLGEMLLGIGAGLQIAA